MVSFSMKTRAQMPEELVDAAVLDMKNRLLKDLGDEIVSIIFFGSTLVHRFLTTFTICSSAYVCQNPNLFANFCML